MDLGSQPVSDVRLVERVCVEFEVAWRYGERPRIEDYLRERSEPGRSALLRALVKSELESRRRLGERPSLEEYQTRFPADGELIRREFADETPTVKIGQPAAVVVTPPAAPASAARGELIAPAKSLSLEGPGQSLGETALGRSRSSPPRFLLSRGSGTATIERVMRAQVASELLALRDADVEALQLLFAAHQFVASMAANDARPGRRSARLPCKTVTGTTAVLLRSPELAELRAALAPWMGEYEYDGFRILDRQGHSIASSRDVTVGGAAGREEVECLGAVFEGRATVSRPRPSEVRLLDVDGKERLGLPTMFVLAPIREDDGRVTAALGFRMRPERTFTRVLNVARFGLSGETFAFDATGLLLSESRFDDDLKRIGLIADAPHVRSTLSLELRNPGVDMTTGARPVRRRGKQPLTRLVAEAVQGPSGVDVEGDRDYRGVPVIGAWTWLPEYGFGVVTKVDRAEAFRPLAILPCRLWSLFALPGRRRDRRILLRCAGGPTAAPGASGRPGRQPTRAVHARKADWRGRDGCSLSGPPRDAPPSDRSQAASPR